MLKTKAIELLGGSSHSAAKSIGITYQAVEKWPDILPQRIADRVLGVYFRINKPKSVPPGVGGKQKEVA
jgi:hypothetical protein